MRLRSLTANFILASLAVFFCGCSNNSNTSSLNSTSEINTTESVVTEVSTEVLPASETTQPAKDNGKSENTTTHQNNSAESEKNTAGSISIDVSEHGNIETRTGDMSTINLNRPSSMKGNEVFDGWSQEELVSQIMEGSVAKEDELTLTAESVNISNSDNVIYNDVTYVNSGMDSISIPVNVGGNTNFAIIELEISYDTSLLEFESFISKDTDVECNCPEPGLIYISFVSTDNVSADIELCNIQFKNISAEGTETSLKYNIKDLAAWNSDKTDYIDVNHEVINSRIVMF